MTELADFQIDSPWLEIPLVQWRWLLLSIVKVLIVLWSCGQPCCEVRRTGRGGDEGGVE
jgi:hypothetical protein